jgi:SAM-dependent methyltransferase
VAREAARLGFTAVGTDLSPRAIAQAQARATGGVRYRVDDVRRSQLEGTFDVIVDRGCLHTLDPQGAQAYAAAVRRRSHPGSLLILKLHAEDEPGGWHTRRYRAADLERLLGPDFQLVRWSGSSIPGNHAPPPRAWLAIFERVSAEGPAP